MSDVTDLTNATNASNATNETSVTGVTDAADEAATKLKQGPGRVLGTVLAAFLLAALHQYLFYGKLAGVSYPIFTGLFYAFMFYFARDKIRKSAELNYLWFGVIFLLSLTYALFHNLFFFGLNLAVIPVLILLHMTYMLSDYRPSWSQFGIIGKALEHLFPQSLRHWPTVFKVFRGTGGNRAKDGHKQVLNKVLIGLGISCPLLLIVISLLSSADGVFHYVLEGLPHLLDRVSFDEIMARSAWILLLGMGFFGLVWGFVDFKKYDWNVRPPEFGPAPEPVSFRVDPVILTTVLVAINTVYVLFVVVQFSYLFGAWEGVLPVGKSYADYARSGFFELMTVTAINFIILLVALLAGGKSGKLLHKISNILLYILVGCSMVMLYSAYTRLALYEEVYGYTYIRFLVHAFMIFLALLLCLAAVRIAIVRFPLAKCYVVLGLLSYVVMNYIGMDTIIANNNIQRYEVSGKLDDDYLARLSPEAISSLIRFSREENGKLDGYLRDKLGTAVQQERQWPSFNVSQYQERRKLEKYFGE